MKRSRVPVLAAGLLLLVLSACRPVLAIGWEELTVIGLLILLLFAPLLLRMFRAVSRYRGSKKKERD